MSFDLPQINSNQDSWGPSSASIPQRFSHLLHPPFSSPPSFPSASHAQQTPQQQKSSDFRLGRIFDHGMQAQAQQASAKWQGKREEEQNVSDEDEEEFSMVTSKKGSGRGGRQWQQSGRGGQRNTRGYRRGRGGQGRQSQGRFALHSKPSVEIRPTWSVVQTFPFQDLLKASVEQVPAATDLESAGFVEHYDEAYNKSTVKNSILVQNPKRIVYNSTTSDDSIIRDIMEQKEADQEPVTTVYATDFLLAVLMSAPRSVYSWDLVITKKDNTITIDKRSTSNLDLLTVDENAKDPPIFDDNKANLNSAQQLHNEATRVNLGFQEQVVKSKGDREYFDKANPFQEELDDDEIAAIGYKYRQWKLGNYVTVVARCSLDGIDKTGAKDQFLTIRCINQYEPKEYGEWRSKLDSHRGAILMNESRNNNNKFTRWAVQALLSGSNQFKLGFVSRNNFSSSLSHSILSIDSYTPLDFAKQIELNIKNIWGIVKAVVDQVEKQQDGQFVLLKEPNKNMLTLYSVPSNEDIEEPEVEEVEEADVSDSEEQK